MVHYRNGRVFNQNNILQVKCRLQTHTLQNWRVFKNLTFCQAHPLSLIMQVTNGVSVRGKFRLSIQKGKNNNLDSGDALSHEINLPKGCGRNKKILKHQKVAVRHGVR